MHPKIIAKGDLVMSSNQSLSPIHTPSSYPSPLSLIEATGTQLATKTDMKILRRGSQAATHDLCTAILAYGAMDNTIMLSMLEGRCFELAPWGEERYKAIVNAYVTNAVIQIINF